MNHLIIIGNLTSDPEARTTSKGTPVTVFTVAVNDPRGAEARDADFFRVSAWRGLAENCAKYLAKGRKVAVCGSVHLNTYESNGKTRATMDVIASDVQFLTPKETPVESPKNAVKTQTPKTDAQSGMVVVNDDDELPF